MRAASGPTRPAINPRSRRIADAAAPQRLRADAAPPDAATGDKPSRTPHTAKDGSAARVGVVSILLTVFVMAMIVPITFHLGGLRLSPIRILLLLAVIPMAMALLQGRAGPLRAADLFIGLHCLWIGVALIAVEGTGSIPFAGITVVELGGGYLIGRVLVRNAAEFTRLVMVFLASLAILAPFALIEFVTDWRPLQVVAGMIAETFEKAYSSRGRIGFYRVMGGFEHPILYGLYCCIALGHVLYMVRWSPGWRLIVVAGVTAMTFMSLSSAPLLAVGIQFGLWAWDRQSGGRWGLLALLVVVAYVAVDMASNRTPLTLVISYLTFDSFTGYIRIAIFDYGLAAALANPVFGIGHLGEWERPPWLTESVDNFWLVTAMRYGFPALAFLVVGIVLGTVAILRARLTDEVTRNQRTGYMISLAAIFVTLATVHMWGATSVFVMMWLGAGMWLADAGTDGTTPDGPVGDAARRAARTPGPGRRGAPPAGTTTAQPDTGAPDDPQIAPADNPDDPAGADAPLSRFTRQNRRHDRTKARRPAARPTAPPKD